MTTLAHEAVKHRRWQLKPEFAQLRIFEELLTNEFISPAEQLEWQIRALRDLLNYAVTQTPYYGQMFARLGLTTAAIAGPGDLPRLPILRKAEVIERADDLRARSLPPGQHMGGQSRSSGTTGRPVVVHHTVLSNNMFTFLWHRTVRWFGWDPRGTFLDVRIAQEVNRRQGSGGLVQSPHWSYLGQMFHTGPEYIFASSQPMAQQVAWVRQVQPHYALSYPGIFEEWLLANGGANPSPNLQSLLSGGSQLTPSLRQRLEQSYGVRVQDSYGLNEIGKVALRCEAGRFHVHTEHCLVEIVRTDGQPAAPGETGHVLVTGFRNLAMPLIRYDTGDLAEVTAGPCPCGRTLPSFGDIAGRFVRYAGLPAGTRERVRALRGAVENSSPELLAFLRRYQICQDRQNNFQLKLSTAAPIPEAFRTAVQRAWETIPGFPPTELTLVEVAEIPLSPSGKLLDFTSELYQDASVVPPGLS